MFLPRRILYIRNFDFGDEHAERNKYLIVLHKVDDTYILVSLTTSKDHIPERLIQTEKRCLREAENNIHSYIFPKEKVVGNNGFSFPRNTFIDINKSQVFQKELSHLAVKYIDSGLTEEKDSLNEEEYHNLLYCISKARHIPVGIKRQIESVLSEYYSREQVN
ncbi:MAG: hypothetical protein MUC87_09110 [Bacteroidia bacterium]|jgi:hypothetical protein|nr:hypothetical protein [Bacteroidia bacterium]